MESSKRELPPLNFKESPSSNNGTPEPALTSPRRHSEIRVDTGAPAYMLDRDSGRSVASDPTPRTATDPQPNIPPLTQPNTGLVTLDNPSNLSSERSTSSTSSAVRRFAQTMDNYQGQGQLRSDSLASITLGNSTEAPSSAQQTITTPLIPRTNSSKNCCFRWFCCCCSSSTDDNGLQPDSARSQERLTTSIIKTGL